MLRGSMTNFGKGNDGTNVTINGLEAGGIYDIWLVTLRNQPFDSGEPDGTEQYVGWWSTTNTTTFIEQPVGGCSGRVNQHIDLRGWLQLRALRGCGGEWQRPDRLHRSPRVPLLDGSNNDHRLGLNGIQIKESAPVSGFGCLGRCQQRDRANPGSTTTPAVRHRSFRQIGRHSGRPGMLGPDRRPEWMLEGPMMASLPAANSDPPLPRFRTPGIYQRTLWQEFPPDLTHRVRSPHSRRTRMAMPLRFTETPSTSAPPACADGFTSIPTGSLTPPPVGFPMQAARSSSPWRARQPPPRYQRPTRWRWTM